MLISAVEIRRTREALGEHQAQFGIRFEVTRRTIIRWEKSGNVFSEWGGWRREDRKTAADLWHDAVKASKDSPAKSTTAIGAGKPKAARRRPSAKKAVAVKRRRGSATRRRSVVRSKARRAKR